MDELSKDLRESKKKEQELLVKMDDLLGREEYDANKANDTGDESSVADSDREDDNSNRSSRKDNRMGSNTGDDVPLTPSAILASLARSTKGAKGTSKGGKKKAQVGETQVDKTRLPSICI